MAEARPETMARPVPDHVGAVFETGKNLPFLKDWAPPHEPLVLTKDILKKEERGAWLLENIRVFSDGTLPSPENQWKLVIDFWLTELKVAAKNAETAVKDPKERDKFREGIKETELNVKAMFAVSSSARAMEQTAGSAAKYVSFMTGMPWRGGRDPDLDVQDYWAEFLLHKDPKKLRRVLAHPLVQLHYERLLKDAGVGITGERPTEKKELLKWLTKPNWQIPDKDRVLRESKLVKYLMGKNPFLEKPTLGDSDEEKERKAKAKEKWEEEEKKTSFNEYITDVLLADKELRKKHLGEGWSEENQWAAAKLACDAFLVDKYTKWEYDLDQRMLAIQEKRDEKEEGLQLMPFPGWGGNPLRAIIEPAFLPKRIKRMYRKEDRAILEMTDLAFRPKDKVPKEWLEKKLPPSMVCHLKAYARFNTALWAFLGTSRGGAIPQWTEDTMYKELPMMAELLDQVYGLIDKPRANTGKHIVGAMMTRIIQCKALALAVESTRPKFRDKMAEIFGEEKDRPFRNVMQYIWGPHYDASSGLLASFAGGRTRLVFKDNDYGAKEANDDAYDLLYTQDQDPKRRGQARILRAVGLAMDIAQALAKTAEGKRRG